MPYTEQELPPINFLETDNKPNLQELEGSAAVMWDRLFPPKAPALGRFTAKSFAQLEKLTLQTAYPVESLSHLLEAVIQSATRLKKPDTEYSTDVVIYAPHALGIYRSLFLLSEVVGEIPSLFFQVAQETESFRHRGKLELCVHLLSIMEKLAALHHPAFRPLAEYLRLQVVSDPQVSDYDKLQRWFSGSLINQPHFWLEGYSSIPSLSFPSSESESSEKRAILTTQSHLRKLKVAQIARKKFIPGYHLSDMVSEYRDKPQAHLFLSRRKKRHITRETKTWPKALLQLSENITLNDETEEGDLAYLYDAIKMLVAHFSHRLPVPADRHLSRKAKRHFSLPEDEQADEIYYQNMLAFLQSGLSKKNPLLYWLFAFRDPSLTVYLQRSILEDPHRFIDLEKLILHELSKKGLLQSSGEQALIFRKTSTQDDLHLVRGLPRLLRELQDLADFHPEVGSWVESSAATDLPPLFQQTLTTLKSSNLPFANLVTEQNLAAVKKAAALDRFHQLAPEKREQFEALILSLVAKFTNKRTGELNPWRSLDSLIASGLMYYLVRLRWLGSPELQQKKGKPQQKGQLVFSKKRYGSLESLPFLPLKAQDNSLEHFIANSDGVEISTPRENLQTYTLPEASQKIDKKYSPLAYTVETQGGSVPLFSGLRHEAMYYLGETSPGTQQWLVSTRPAYTREQLPVGIRESSIPVLSGAYSLATTFNYDVAKATNDALAGDVELQRIHQDLLDRLQSIRLDQDTIVRHQVLNNILRLNRYFLGGRHYEISEDTVWKENPLGSCADNPEMGMNCDWTARSVTEYLASFGLKCTVLLGEMPFYYKGGIFTSNMTRHAICLVLLPGGWLYELDFTPPVTSQTSTRTRFLLQPDTPQHFDGYSTKFGEGKVGAGLKDLAAGTGTALVVAGLLEVLFKDPLADLRAKLPFLPTGQEVGERQPPLTLPKLDSETIFLGVLLGVVGGAGFFVTFDFLKKRKKESWSFQTRLEKMFTPNEQIIMASALYPLQRDGETQENFEELTQVYKLLHNFEWEKAKPILELLALLLSTPGTQLSQRVQEYAESENYQALYDEVARAAISFQTKEHRQSSWLKRLLLQPSPELHQLQQRGHQLLNTDEPSFLDQNDPTFRLFCRSLEMMRVVLALKEDIGEEFQTIRMLGKLRMSAQESGQDLLKDRSRSAAWRVKDRLFDLIWQLERSLRAGAMELITPEELKALKDELWKRG